MSNNARRTKRILAGVLAGALALSVTPILGLTGTAGALQPATGDGSVCEDVTPATEPFTDVAANDVAINEIVCLVATGITKGVTATTYQPTAPVSRRQMALFLVRLADQINSHAVAGKVTPLPAGDGVTPFTDITGESAEAKVAIDRLNQAGIAKGVTATKFVPGDSVTRRQMAKFIVRLQEFMAGAAITPDNAPNAFTDDNGDSGEAELNVLAAEGVFVGNAAPNAGTVSPGANISRRQMALVIVRKAQYLFEKGVITRLFAEDDTNQTLVVSPTAAATQANASTRAYTATGLGTTPVDIVLFNCANVQTTNAIVTFTGTTPAADVDTAAPGNTGGTAITVVNGVSLGSTDQVVPTNGSISFTVTGPAAAQPGVCVVPVVIADGADDDDLDIGANNRPTDGFGVGGQTNFTPAAATAGPIASSDVTTVDKATNRFSACTITGGIFEPTGPPCATYTYDANDTFTVDAVSVGLDTFEAALSPGDDVTGTFTTDPGGVSNFTLVDESPGQPLVTPSATPGAQSTSVTLDITAGVVDIFNTNPNADSYTIYRLTSGDADCTDANEVFPTNYTQVGTVPFDPDGTTTFVSSGLTPSTNYCFVVVAVDDGDVSPPSDEDPIATAATNTAETDDPDAEDTELFTSGGFPTDIDNGDVIKICFDEVLAPLNDADAEAIQISDADAIPSVLQLTNGTNATFALNVAASTDTDAVNGAPATACPIGAELTITITGAPTVITAGTTPGVAVASATITNAADIEDLAGNLFAPAGDNDVSVNVEGAEPS